MSRRRRSAALAFGLSLLGVGVATAQEPAPDAPAPDAPLADAPSPGPVVRGGFETVLWVPAERVADPAHLRAVRDAGFSAVNLGPDGDPAPLLAAGLGWYLDQPVGKGFLELRDRDFLPLRNDYERRRDPDALVRPQCLRDPARTADLGIRAAAAALRHAEAGRPPQDAPAAPGLLFVALADEASTTRHGDPLDLCRCDGCRTAFRAFALQRHGGLAAVNAAWGTDFAAEPAIEPLSTDQVRRRELGGLLLPQNLQPWADWLDFVDDGFATAVAGIAGHVRRQLPGVPVGLTGLQPPLAFGGHDYARLLPGLSLLEPYDLAAAPELARSLAPAASYWSTLTLPTDPQEAAHGRFEALVTARLGEAAARGQAGVVVWNDAVALGQDGRPTAAGAQFRAAVQRLRPMLDACAGAVPLADDVWICESHASVRAWWMLDSNADGLTWVRRLGSYEVEHSTSVAARRSWVKLLADLGIRGRFVAADDLPVQLLQRRPRLLILPATVALGDRACAAITAYVKQGGVALADHSTALYGDDLVLRQAGGLDALFGLRERSLRQQDLAVREGRGAPGTRVAERLLRAELAEQLDDAAVFAEQRQGRGRAVYLNLPVCDYARLRLDPAAVAVAVDLRRRVRQVLRAAGVDPRCDVRGDGLPTCIQRSWLRARDGRTLLVVRADAVDDPAVLVQLAGAGARPVQLEFPQPVRLRSTRGEDLGERATFELPFDPVAGLCVEVRR
ncbi:MAG: hypothetical protein AB7O97_13445 [Planctomycetota bacterium]